MPQKACERYIFHVMAYAFLNASKSKNLIFGSISVLKLITFLNAFLNAPFLSDSATENEIL